MKLIGVANMLKPLSLCLVLLLIGSAALTAAEPATYRDLARKYFKDGDGADLAKLVGFTQPVKNVIALEYKVLLTDKDKEVPVDPKTHEFKIGDKIRVLVEPLHDCYVYIFQIGASGKSGFLLPVEGEDAPLAKSNKAVALPNDGFLEFSEPPGEEQLLVVATEKPVADRAVLARVLTKKPGEADTPEEKAVRQTLKATVKQALKSVRERQQEVDDKTVMWRGLATDKARDELVKDVQTRGVTDGTIEEPSANGTAAVYVSVKEDPQAKLLVSIPLKSISTKSKTTKP
jgi:hypothetical protein